MSIADKITTLSEIGRKVQPFRHAGKTVVLANGCFDLLHVGHVRFLQGAAEHGDVLVVAVNDDESVRRSKGSDRPVLPETERLFLIASLACVDFALPFPDDTVTRVLETVRPDVHAKGPDYGKPENVPEFPITQSIGGRTVLVGDPKDHNTRDIIAHLRRLPQA